MTLGDVIKFTSDQAEGYDLKDKMHVWVGTTDHFRAPDEYAFLFISSSDYGGCFPITQTEYHNFLVHDSFISCGKLVFYSREYLLNAKVKKVGAISDAHLVALHGHLVDHDVMAGWEIGVACKALSAKL